MRTVLYLVISITCALAGCSSPQVRYHTLVSPAPVSRVAAPSEFAIAVLPVGVPAQLDSQQVVVRQSDSRVVVLDNDRWLSPLGDELQTALSLAMTQQLNTEDVAGIARDNSKPVVRVLLQIRRFDSWPGNAVSLDADWSLSTSQGGENRRLVCRSHLSQSVSGDPAQMFAAWQGVVERLATQTAETAVQWMATGSAACRRS
ncbi:membrane integrity-associated transporter subunit PqiC [Klebsiella sp. R390]|uniref:PqiC family protein n=1 Tax=Klebsiella sp. R390 TaxID=2755400 RepID=UPI003DAA0D89